MLDTKKKPSKLSIGKLEFVVDFNRTTEGQRFSCGNIQQNPKSYLIPQVEGQPADHKSPKLIVFMWEALISSDG